MADTYVVRAGDSWARIAGLVYGDQRMFQELMQANSGIGVLRPGMVLSLPNQKANPAVTIDPNALNTPEAMGVNPFSQEGFYRLQGYLGGGDNQPSGTKAGPPLSKGVETPAQALAAAAAQHGFAVSRGLVPSAGGYTAPGHRGVDEEGLTPVQDLARIAQTANAYQVTQATLAAQTRAAVQEQLRGWSEQEAQGAGGELAPSGYAARFITGLPSSSAGRFLTGFLSTVTFPARALTVEGVSGRAGVSPSTPQKRSVDEAVHSIVEAVGAVMGATRNVWVDFIAATVFGERTQAGQALRAAAELAAPNLQRQAVAATHQAAATAWEAGRRHLWTDQIQETFRDYMTPGSAIYGDRTALPNAIGMDASFSLTMAAAVFGETRRDLGIIPTQMSPDERQGWAYTPENIANVMVNFYGYSWDENAIDPISGRRTGAWIKDSFVPAKPPNTGKGAKGGPYDNPRGWGGAGGYGGYGGGYGGGGYGGRVSYAAAARNVLHNWNIRIT